MGIFFKNPQISYHINMSRKVFIQPGFPLYHVAIPTDVSLLSLSRRQSRRQSRAAGLQRMTRFPVYTNTVYKHADMRSDRTSAAHLIPY